jgi:hypothetical protein
MGEKNKIRRAFRGKNVQQQNTHATGRNTSRETGNHQSQNNLSNNNEGDDADGDFTEDASPQPGAVAVNEAGAEALRPIPNKGMFRYLSTNMPPELLTAAASSSRTNPNLSSPGGGEEGGTRNTRITRARWDALREEEPKSQKRLTLFLVAAVLVVVAAVAVVIVVITGSDANGGEPLSTTPPPAPAPTKGETTCPGFEVDPGNLSADEAVEYNLLLDGFIAEVLPDFDVGSVASEPCSPTNLALHWMARDIVEARKQGRSDTPSKQRFVLVFLYFSWNGDQWPDVNDSWLQHDAWLTEDSAKPAAVECEWGSVVCDGDVVVGLDFGANGISGTIPTEIGMLHLGT